MAAVALSAVWIQDAQALGTAVQVHATSIVETQSTDGSVRSYANGRQRSVAKTARPRQVAMTLTLVAQADGATLASWEGRMVLIRDPFGLKMYAVYYSTVRTQREIAGVDDISLTATEVTFSEAV